jgi:hypothetical protein
MSLTDTPTIRQDATLDRPLRRVAYEAGMLLGLEATREEQDYHRRRLTRALYWLHGAGTVAGLRVSIDPETDPDGDPDRDRRVRILVGPGVAIDGLGRELLVHETHCLDLGDWLDAQDPLTLRDGFDDAADLLRLRVAARYQDCPVAAQPVLARKLNLGTDPVQPSRIADSVLLELVPDPPGVPDPGLNPWPLHTPLDGPLPTLSASEQARLDALDPNDPDQAPERAVLTLRLRLLHLFEAGWSAPELEVELIARARLPLARITLSTSDPAAPIVNPERLAVDNLARPFVQGTAQLAALAGLR